MNSYSPRLGDVPKSVFLSFNSWKIIVLSWRCCLNSDMQILYIIHNTYFEKCVLCSLESSVWTNYSEWINIPQLLCDEDVGDRAMIQRRNDPMVSCPTPCPCVTERMELCQTTVEALKPGPPAQLDCAGGAPQESWQFLLQWGQHSSSTGPAEFLEFCPSQDPTATFLEGSSLPQ